MRITCALLTALVLFACQPKLVLANGLTEDVPLAGGTAALARAVGVNPVPDLPRFIPELVRLLYNVPEGKTPELDARIERMAHHLAFVRTFQTALAAAQSTGGGVTLADARQKNQRQRLKDFLDLIGLTLREAKGVYTVAPVRSSSGMARAQEVDALRVDVAQVQSKLNAGATVTIEIASELVPVPLTAQLWSTTVFDRSVEPRDLVAAILSDRRAALLCRGLAGLDPPTLDFFATHPALITHFYEHDATVFAAFSDSVHIRNAAIVTPGGADAQPLWEAVVGERANRPQRFLEALFSRSDGRTAYLYSTIDHLAVPQQRFALGLWIGRTATRLERFKALAEQTGHAVNDLQISMVPFDRPTHDFAMLLARVRVGADGSPDAPRGRGFWSRVFESTDMPADPARLLIERESDVDAAWLVDRLATDDVREREMRFQQLLFGQRAFATVADGELPDALIAVRAYMRFPVLMSGLERIGARRPATFAAAVRHADRLGHLDAVHAFVALSQFEGCLAVLVRLVRVQAVSPAQAESLVASLAASPIEDDWYRGGVAAWLQDQLAPALATRGENFDATLISALAGATKTTDRGESLTWEGRRYRVDLAAPERDRLVRINQTVGRIPLDTALALQSIVAPLSGRDLTLSDTQSAATRLKAFPNPPAVRVVSPGVELRKSPRERIAAAAQDLSKIRAAKDLKRVASIVAALGEAVDILLADSLRSLSYALALGDPSGTLVSGVDVSARHDFGLVRVSTDGTSDVAWSPAAQQFSPGVPWHLRGSLLNLDVTLAPLALKRQSTGQAAHPSRLGDNERQSFAVTAALMNPFVLSEQDAQAIVAALERGRHRVLDLAAQPAISVADTLRRVAGLDGWRTSAVQWAFDHRDDPLRFLSYSELLALGDVDAGSRLDAWGAASQALDNCACTRLEVPNQLFILTGRPRLGLLPTQIIDLNLRIALTLHALGVPVSLTPFVLLYATQDFVDDVAPTDYDDWITMVRTAQAFPREKIEDDIAALAAHGPLVPVDSPR